MSKQCKRENKNDTFVTKEKQKIPLYCVKDSKPSSFLDFDSIPTKSIEECDNDLMAKGMTEAKIKEINDSLDKLIDMVFDDYIQSIL